jgi:hypothetical protein
VSLEEQVKHLIENSSVSNEWDYTIEESEDNENTVILHAHPSFLTPELTEELRKRLIFVDASSASYTKEHSTMYFLHYLETEEDTFMDKLANPVSTEKLVDDDPVCDECGQVKTESFTPGELSDLKELLDQISTVATGDGIASLIEYKEIEIVITSPENVKETISSALREIDVKLDSEKEGGSSEQT